MSGLLSLLSQGAMSLQAQQAYSSTVAHNLSNANTAGYSRQRAELATAAPADRFGNAYIGRGAMLQGISQARDRFLEAQLPAAMSNQTRSSAEAQVLTSVNALDLDGSVGPALSAFYGALRTLAQNPGNASIREAASSAGTQLALAFNRTASSLDAARSAVDQQLEGQLPEVNQAASQLASLNAEVRKARAGGGVPNDLLDARQKLGDSLAQLTGATPVGSGEGDLNLVLADGTALVTADRSATLSALPDPANGGHLALQLTKADGSPARPLSTPLGGTLGGIIAARDGALAKAETQLDQLAFDLGGQLNVVAQAGVGLDGTGGRDLFTGLPATSSGAAQAMTFNVDIASDASRFPAGASAVSGDATGVQAMIATETAALSGGFNATSMLARITSDFGGAASRATASSEADGALLAHLEGMRQSASGVSIDEELVNMQKAQRGYEAVTRVIKVADEMLETLMSLK